MEDVKIELTDEEWMSCLDQERDGLPACCGNVSELRDRLFSIVRGGCTVSVWEVTAFLRSYYHAWNDTMMNMDSPVHLIHGQLLAQSEEARKMWDSWLESSKKHIPQKEL